MSKYVQLPPIPSDMPKEAVALIWEYSKFSKERRMELLKELESLHTGNHKEDLKSDAINEEDIKPIPEEEIQDYIDAGYKLIKKTVEEACSLGVWVYQMMIEEGASLEEMIEMEPKSEGMIRSVYELIKDYYSDVL